MVGNHVYGCKPYNMVPNHIYGDIFGLGEYSQQQISMHAASRSSSGCFSAAILANSQFFESNDNSEVKQKREDIYLQYLQSEAFIAEYI